MMDNEQKSIPKGNQYGFDELLLLRQLYQILKDTDYLHEIKEKLESDLDFYAEYVSIIDALQLIDSPEDLPETWYDYNI